LIVADGVGGWSLQGVDSGNFARDLVSQVAKEVRSSGHKQSLKDSLIKAVKETKSVGSSTIAITQLVTGPGDTLAVKSCHLGDSAFVIYRVQETKSHHHCLLEQ
jgi:serine/threonine protein phosphatase PrpC